MITNARQFIDARPRGTTPQRLSHLDCRGFSLWLQRNSFHRPYSIEIQNAHDRRRAKTCYDHRGDNTSE